MHEAFLATHAALLALSRTNREWKGMGATLSALWLDSAGNAVLGHAGDSRVYGCRQGRWRQWTEDHTLGEGVVRRGQMTAVGHTPTYRFNRPSISRKWPL